MKHVFKAEEYLHLADLIAGRAAGPGRPRTAHLRRATSTAYYAVFHELVGQGARRVAGTGQEDHRHTISRWYAHGNFRQTARWVEAITTKKSVPEGVRRLLGPNDHVDPDLAALSESFSELQQARHAADYDPEYNAIRADTLGHVTRAKTAVEAIRRMDRGKVQAFDMFLLLSLGGERMVRNS
ncbi:hypothetical protein [Herbidospora yilanensis]|uniref:hypothetical protein n=1 Tax=Herbidospora yilanensis TaxID=354426 RepID=UPI00078526DD|nr:hypothetical protein [Herbidospora yilanensis]